MKKHHTKDKGDLGVLKAQVDLAEKGWLSLRPQTEHAPFDLVIYKDGIFKRVQVKYRSLDKNGKLEIKFLSYWSNKTGVHKSPVEISEIDIICVYCPELDDCCYISTSEVLDKMSLCLRVESPKNNKWKGVKLFSNYCQVP